MVVELGWCVAFDKVYAWKPIFIRFAFAGKNIRLSYINDHIKNAYAIRLCRLLCAKQYANVWHLNRMRTFYLDCVRWSSCVYERYCVCVCMHEALLLIALSNAMPHFYSRKKRNSSNFDKNWDFVDFDTSPRNMYAVCQTTTTSQPQTAKTTGVTISSTRLSYA